MLKLILAWFITLCRVAVGLLVMKTGFDFTRGGGSFALQQTDTVTGIFVMVLGAYFVFSSLAHHLPGRRK